MTTTLPGLRPIERTQLSQEHADTIRATLPLVGSKIDEITPLFYATMFERHPELIDNLFNRGNQKQGAQQRALAASVATFAAALVNESVPDPRDLLERIGHKHASLGITPDQYQIVHDNLFEAIVKVLGADVVTPDVAAAWDAVYWMMAESLIGFEQDLYAQAGVEIGDVFRRGEVMRRRELSDDVFRFTVAAQDGQAFPAYLPGQYVSVGVTLPDGARQLRQYSLVGEPEGGAGTLTFAVKRVAAVDRLPAGEVSNWLADHVQEGDVIDVTLPFGDLVVDVRGTEPLVLVSAGIGTTPMLGILQALHAVGAPRPVTVLHAEANRGADVFAAERAALVADLPHGRLITWYGDPQAGEDLDPGTAADAAEPREEAGAGEAAAAGREAGARGAEVRTGRLDVAVAGLSDDALVYVCGSNAFLQGVREQLSAAGVADERVHFELFAPNDWLLG